MDNKIKNIILVALFIVAVVLIFVGQRNIGYMGLTMEIVGLFILISILFAYNRGYR